MSKKIIITGHGGYATGVLSSVETILGQNDNVIAIDFNNDINKLVKDYNTIIKKSSNSDIIFICDLVGGSPFKEACKLSGKRIKVIAGCNLGAIIDSILKIDKLSLDELINNLIDMSKKNIILFDSNVNYNKSNNSKGI